MFRIGLVDFIVFVYFSPECTRNGVAATRDVHIALLGDGWECPMSRAVVHVFLVHVSIVWMGSVARIPWIGYACFVSSTTTNGCVSVHLSTSTLVLLASFRRGPRVSISPFEFPFCPVKRSLSNPNRIPFRTQERTWCDRLAIIRPVAPPHRLPHLLRHVHAFVDRT